MKANQSLRNAEEAVSPVIGVILMVAITVVLAAVVFVLVTKLSGNQQNAAENASVSMSSPSSGKIYITLVSAGQNAPYCVNAVSCSSADISITVDSLSCSLTASTGQALLQDSTGGTSGKWDAGETIIIGGTNGGTNCGSGGSTLTSGTTHLVSVIVHGTLLQDNTKVVIS